MKAKDVVVNLVKLNGRELNGQTRLQREAYLLDRCGGEIRALVCLSLLRPLLLRACRWMGGRTGRRSD